MSSFIKQIVSEGQRPDWDEYFKCIALLTSWRSPSERLKVGTVIILDNRIISTGYNGFFSGASHISIMRNGHEENTIHAEQNAICDAAKRGISLEGSTIYITHYPCVNCMKVIIASGIKKIKYIEDYRNDEIVESLAISANNIPIIKI
jgi:dCMP deaminase